MNSDLDLCAQCNRARWTHMPQSDCLKEKVKTPQALEGALYVCSHIHAHGHAFVERKNV